MEEKRRKKKQKSSSESPDNKGDTRSVHESCSSVNEAPPNQEPLTKNQEPDTPPNGGVTRKRSATAARPDDVAEPVWQDFQRLRSQKKSPLTDTALAGLRREAAKAGIGLGDALAFCCEQGWQGFNAGWYAERTGKQPRASPAAASFRERDAAAASERYRRLTGQDSPVVTEIQTMKAIAQ